VPVVKKTNNLSYIAAVSYIYGALTVASLRTKLIENNPEEIIKEVSQMTADSNELATCLPSYAWVPTKYIIHLMVCYANFKIIRR
jgi:hypothetical protein